MQKQYHSESNNSVKLMVLQQWSIIVSPTHIWQGRVGLTMLSLVAPSLCTLGILQQAGWRYEGTRTVRNLVQTLISLLFLCEVCVFDQSPFTDILKIFKEKSSLKIFILNQSNSNLAQLVGWYNFIINLLSLLSLVTGFYDLERGLAKRWFLYTDDC